MTTYWLSDFCSLFNSLNINPFVGDNKNFKFNSLTRLIILTTVISALYLKKNSNEILVAGCISIFLSVIFYMLTYNSAELSVSNNKNAIENYNDSQKILENIDKNLMIGITETGKSVMKNYKDNNKNNITFDYVPQDTELTKQIYFFEGNNMPSQVTETTINPAEYLSGGDKVQTGTVKSLFSLINKNL
tara:strand:- start:506 stop:1072 length:567 start_codon:yes stop_codon:yes gene_type:complete